MIDICNLEELRHVANIGELTVQISLCAAKFTAYMRMFGLPLAVGMTRVPLQQEVDNHLRQLVSGAYDGLVGAMREAPVDAVDLQVEGYDSDDYLFDVTLHTVPMCAGHLQLMISLRG